MALLMPGIPIVSLYVGLRVFKSNSTQAFLKYGFEYSSAFSSPKCVVMQLVVFFKASFSSIICAKIEPS